MKNIGASPPQWLSERTLVVLRCECGEQFKRFDGSEERSCQRCRDERYRAEQRQKDTERRAKETRRGLPRRFRDVDADKIKERVTPAAPVEHARERLAQPGFASNIVLMSKSTGDGKTTAACYLLIEWAALRDQVGSFTTALELAEARRQAKFGTGEADSIVRANRAPLLLIDEIGAEQTRDLGLDEVIRHRYDAKLATIFTSGFDREALANKFGSAIERRIFEGALVIRLGGAR
jgi:DNA replication protein DnaC